MIRRIIKQIIDAKKLPVSSFEWSQILRKMHGDGAKLTIQEAITMYNANPQVSAYGGSSSKEIGDLRFICTYNTCYVENHPTFCKVLGSRITSLHIWTLPDFT